MLAFSFFPFSSISICHTPALLPQRSRSRCTTSNPAIPGEHLSSTAKTFHRSQHYRSQIHHPCWGLDWLACSNGRVRRPGLRNVLEGLSTGPSCLVQMYSTDCSSMGNSQSLILSIHTAHCKQKRVYIASLTSCCTPSAPSFMSSLMTT